MTNSEQSAGKPCQRFRSPFWISSLDDAFKLLASRHGGLTAAEAAERLVRDGPNVLDAKYHQSLLTKALRRIAEPLTAILLLSAAIYGFAGDWQSFFIIVLIVSLSVIADVGFLGLERLLSPWARRARS